MFLGVKFQCLKCFPLIDCTFIHGLFGCANRGDLLSYVSSKDITIFLRL